MSEQSASLAVLAIGAAVGFVVWVVEPGSRPAALPAQPPTAETAPETGSETAEDVYGLPCDPFCTGFNRFFNGALGGFDFP